MKVKPECGDSLLGDTDSSVVGYLETESSPANNFLALKLRQLFKVPSSKHSRAVASLAPPRFHFTPPHRYDATARQPPPGQR